MSRRPRELTPLLSDAHRLGAELQQWRVLRGMTQDRLGQAIHHSGALVSKVEKAQRKATLAFCQSADAALRTDGVLARMWQAAARPSQPPTPSDHDAAGADLVAASLRWVEDVSGAMDITCRMWRSELDRRTLLASSAWVSSAFAGSFRSWLLSEPDVLAGGSGRRIGQAEVDALWSMCASFADADHRLGGGYARSTLMHYLDAVVRPLLLDGDYSDGVGRDLMAAAARLCDLCAFMSFDSAEQGLAQRYFVQALRLAHASGNQALAAHVLGDMSMQAHHLGHADRALELAEAGYRTGVGCGSPSTAARCAVLQGRAHALRGDRVPASRSRLIAEQNLDTTATEPEPLWIQFFTAEQLAIEGQYIASDLGDHEEVKRFAAAAGSPAIDMQRRRVLSTATLADAHLPTSGPGKDVDHACALLGEVLPALPALTSVRARNRVAGVRRKLLQYPSRPSVREFEHRYEQTALVPAHGPV